MSLIVGGQLRLGTWHLALTLKLGNLYDIKQFRLGNCEWTTWIAHLRRGIWDWAACNEVRGSIEIVLPTVSNNIV